MTCILVVDDLAANREYLATLLGYSGYSVLEAADGADALAAVRRDRPDLVIADILMPTMDGYEFVRRLRSDTGIAHIPVMFYTAVYHEHETRRLAETCGVSHVLIKPCEPEVVLRTVQEALRKQTPPTPAPDEETFRREHLRVVVDKLTQTIEDLGFANERFGALIEINLKLASEKDPVKLLDALCPAARGLIGSRHAILAIGGRGDTAVKHCVGAGMDPAISGKVAVQALDRGAVGRAYRERESFRLSNPGGDPSELGLPAEYPPVHAALVAPVVSLKHVYGWICLTERIGSDGFSDEDEKLLTILAAQVGRIYENGDLYLEVQESERKFRQLTEHIHEVFFLVDPELTRTEYISPAYEEIWGRSVDDLYSNPRAWLEAVHPDDNAFVAAAFAKAHASGRFDYEYRILQPGGDIRWVHSRGFPICDEQGHLYRIAGIAEDITERRQAEDKVNRLNRVYAVLSGINAAIVRIRDRQALFEEACRIMTDQGRFEMAWIGVLNDESRVVDPVAWRGPACDYEVVSGIEFSADESVPGGRTTVGRAIRGRRPIAIDDFRAENELQPVFSEIARRGYRKVISLPLVSDGSCLGVIVLYSKEAGEFDDEETALLVELAGDISFALDYISNEERVEYLAFHDPLTGLANRATLHRCLTEAINTAGTQRKSFALLLMNINNFREINDSLGHNNGDLLLKETARRVVDTLWESDIAASLGGDEFAILLPSLADKRDIDQVAGKIRTALQEPFAVHDLPVNVEARLGISLYPDHGNSADLLWQRADIALCAAKELHRAWIVYEPGIDHYDPARLALIGGLRAAMEQDELVLHFQPSIDLRTGRIRGVEALLRWQHPDRGLIYPDEFIPLAERTGLIDALTSWVVASTLRQAHDWHRSGVSLDVAVNISARNLQAPGFCNEILDFARSSGVPLEQLSLEITESAIMADPDRARSVLQELNESGIRLSVDDFGTGHSSLAYVRDLPVSTIKIDKSFVIDFKQSRNAAIVSTAIDLGHNLGMTVTAEGVEDEETWRMLRELGCDVAQGYFFSKPLTVDQLAEWLAESTWGPEQA